MDGKRIQNYWSNEMQAMLDTYKQFQILIPAENRNGAAHNGEGGRYVETLIREYLKRYLPKDLEVLTGFILRPAVKTGLKNRSRKNEVDSQLLSVRVWSDRLELLSILRTPFLPCSR